MKNRVLPAAIAVCLMTMAIVAPMASAARPNVILVMTDDQGYGDLGCHGNPILKTPHLDKLHAESIRFTDFHVSPFCTPTRAALMSGNHPGYTGAYRTSSGRTMMHADEKTVADLFANAGYTTGMVGKWHLGDNAPHRPQDRGFQDVLWHRCGGIGQASDYWGNDYFDDTYEHATADNMQGTFKKFEGYCTDVWFREGIRFIEDNRNKPFFLYIAPNAPHGPYYVAPEWAKPYQGAKDVANANFYGMVANIDHNMGILRQRLNKLGLADNTILIFMTDNGTAAGAKFEGLDSEAVSGFNAGMRGKKSSIYDGGHRVPFFIHWPKGGLTGGRNIDTLSAHIDVLPTLADLCGIPVPKAYAPDGISLKPLLAGSNKPWPRTHHFVQFHGAAGGNALPPQPFSHSVVLTKRWRLVNHGDQFLYDIQADPAQRNDVSKEHPEVAKQLREAYKPFWANVSPPHDPGANRSGQSGSKPNRPLFPGLAHGKRQSALVVRLDPKTTQGDRPVDGECQTSRPLFFHASTMAIRRRETLGRRAGQGVDRRTGKRDARSLWQQSGSDGTETSRRPVRVVDLSLRRIRPGRWRLLYGC